MRRFLAVLVVSLFLSGTIIAAPPAYDPTPRIGVVIPKGPPDYALWYDNLHNSKDALDGSFKFTTGTVSGIPVVVIVQPAPGEVLRALGAITMIHDFNLRVLLYPGTSGGHLPKGQMSIGDVVLGAKNVDHDNYHLSSTGQIEADEFAATVPGALHFGPLYADPQLLSMLACSATLTARQTTFPAWTAPVSPDRHPQIFYFGIQGSSTIWSDNQAYTQATMKVFHEIDEDGDWYSNLAATLYKVPFLEVSVISNSIFAFPDRSHGAPAPPPGEPDSHLLAQRLSNRIMLDLIARYGKQILAGTFTTPLQNPYPPHTFEGDLGSPHDLLRNCKRE